MIFDAAHPPSPQTLFFQAARTQIVNFVGKYLPITLLQPAKARSHFRFQTICAQGVTFDGATLLTGSHDGTARVWNVATGMLEYKIIPLSDSWLVRSSDQKVIRHGPNLWRYAYSLIPSKNGLPRVTVPNEESLSRLQVK